MSIAKKVDAAFEEFREYLVTLVGDHHGVHSVIDDAKAAIVPHVQEATPIEVVTGLDVGTLQEGSTQTEVSSANASNPVTPEELNKAIDDAIAAAPPTVPTEEKPTE